MMPSEQLELSLPKYQKEDEVTNDSRDFISTLPTDKGWLSANYHQYQGFWYSTRYMPGVLACQKHFQARDSDIILVTTPKSGTTWLKSMTFALVNRFHFPENKHHPLLTANPHDLVPFLDLKLYLENVDPDLSSLSSPRLFATHLPTVSLPESIKVSSCKIVYLCRNPKDTFVSLWHFTNRLKLVDTNPNELEEVFDKFCRGVSMCGPFWDHVLGYWRESIEKPEKVLFLKYEELKEQPFVHLKKLAEFVGCPFYIEEEEMGKAEEFLELCSFDNLSNLEVNKNGKLASGEENKAFFRKGEVGDWNNHLPADMIQKLDQLTEEKLHGTGLTL